MAIQGGDQILILVFSTLLFVVALVVVYWTHSQHLLRVVVSRDEQVTPPHPLISVIVPARNEARNIRACIEALLLQTYPNSEIIVVDDRSTDATPRILAEIEARLEAAGDPQLARRLKVVAGCEPPPGWAGKPHALVQGAGQAQGDWLCFIDADTFASPELLMAALAQAQRQKADLFTILTAQELLTFWEKVIQPLVFSALSVGFPAERVNDPHQPDAIANGQFILIRRPVYQAIGGHAAVHERIDEDKALAELVKGNGYRLIVADGRAVAHTRMYTNLGEIWEGWTKNIFLGMRQRLGLLLVGALTGLAAALFLPLWLAAGLGWFAARGDIYAALAALQALIVWAYLLWMRVQACRAFEISPFYSLTLPLGALVFTLMMSASTYKVLSGQGVTWKGRTYS